MNERNIIVNNYVSFLNQMVTSLTNVTQMFNDDVEQTYAAVKTADIMVLAINSQMTILQASLDEYSEVLKS